MEDTNKRDAGKPRLALVPFAAIQAIGEGMTYGVAKYEENSWKKVEAWRWRDALMRHLCAYLADPYSIDEESGLPHLWHMTTNAAILCGIEDFEVREAMRTTPVFILDSSIPKGSKAADKTAPIMK